jgi:predicted transcriptional regulator
MEPLGRLQLRIMHHIWKTGPCTVHEMHAAMNAIQATRSLAYTTFLTVLRNLTKRGFLEQVKGNRAHVFVPLIDEQTYKLAQVRQMRQDFCGGDVAVLLRYLAQDEEIDAGKRDQIRAIASI